MKKKLLSDILEQLKDLNLNLKEIHAAQLHRNKLIEQVVAQDDAGDSDSPSPGKEKIDLDPKPEQAPEEKKKKSGRPKDDNKTISGFTK